MLTGSDRFELHALNCLRSALEFDRKVFGSGAYAVRPQSGPEGQETEQNNE